LTPPDPLIPSGGPCFRLGSDSERIELAGFIYEAHKEFELMRVRQASLISPTGYIAPTPPGTPIKAAPAIKPGELVKMVLCAVVVPTYGAVA
jgi:hypothetical protein